MLMKGMNPSLTPTSYGLNNSEDWTLKLWVTTNLGEKTVEKALGNDSLS